MNIYYRILETAKGRYNDVSAWNCIWCRMMRRKIAVVWVVSYGLTDWEGRGMFCGNDPGVSTWKPTGDFPSFFFLVFLSSLFPLYSSSRVMISCNKIKTNKEKILEQHSLIRVVGKCFSKGNHILASCSFLSMNHTILHFYSSEVDWRWSRQLVILV